MGAGIMQAYDSALVRNLEAQEKDSEKCEFDNSLEGVQLQPISSISISIVFPMDKSRQSFVVESDTVRREIGKFWNYLWVAGFMVLSYCSILQKIFESVENVPCVLHM